MNQRRDIPEPVLHLQGARMHPDARTYQGALGPRDVQLNAVIRAEPHREEEHPTKDANPVRAGDHQLAKVAGEDNLLPFVSRHYQDAPQRSSTPARPMEVDLTKEDNRDFEFKTSQPRTHPLAARAEEPKPEISKIVVDKVLGPVMVTEGIWHEAKPYEIMTTPCNRLPDFNDEA